MIAADFWTAELAQQVIWAGPRSRVLLAIYTFKNWQQSAAWGTFSAILVLWLSCSRPLLENSKFIHLVTDNVSGFSFKDADNVVQVNYVAFVDEIRRSIGQRLSSPLLHGIKSGWSAERPRGKCQVQFLKHSSQVISSSNPLILAITEHQRIGTRQMDECSSPSVWYRERRSCPTIHCWRSILQWSWCAERKTLQLHARDGWGNRLLGFCRAGQKITMVWKRTYSEEFTAHCKAVKAICIA